MHEIVPTFLILLFIVSIPVVVVSKVSNDTPCFGYKRCDKQYIRDGAMYYWTEEYGCLTEDQYTRYLERKEEE